MASAADIARLFCSDPSPHPDVDAITDKVMATMKNKASSSAPSSQPAPAPAPAPPVQTAPSTSAPVTTSTSSGGGFAPGIVRLSKKKETEPETPAPMEEDHEVAIWPSKKRPIVMEEQEQEHEQGKKPLKKLKKNGGDAKDKSSSSKKDPKKDKKEKKELKENKKTKKEKEKKEKKKKNKKKHSKKEAESDSESNSGTASNSSAEEEEDEDDDAETVPEPVPATAGSSITYEFHPNPHVEQHGAGTFGTNGFKLPKKMQAKYNKFIDMEAQEASDEEEEEAEDQEEDEEEDGDGDADDEEDGSEKNKKSKQKKTKHGDTEPTKKPKGRIVHYTGSGPTVKLPLKSNAKENPKHKGQLIVKSGIPLAFNFEKGVTKPKSLQNQVQPKNVYWTVTEYKDGTVKFSPYLCCNSKFIAIESKLCSVIWRPDNAAFWQEAVANDNIDKNATVAHQDAAKYRNQIPMCPAAWFKKHQERTVVPTPPPRLPPASASASASASAPAPARPKEPQATAAKKKPAPAAPASTKGGTSSSSLASSLVKVEHELKETTDAMEPHLAQFLSETAMTHDKALWCDAFLDGLRQMKSNIKDPSISCIILTAKCMFDPETRQKMAKFIGIPAPATSAAQAPTPPPPPPPSNPWSMVSSRLKKLSSTE